MAEERKSLGEVIAQKEKGRLTLIIYVRTTLRGRDVEIMPASQQDVKDDQGECLLERQMPSFQKEGKQKSILRHPFGA